MLKDLNYLKNIGRAEADSIYNCDCLDGMPFIADHSVDAIICDLPYGATECKWDSVIPFEPLWEQYNRIIKENSAIVLFGSQPFTSAMVMSNPKHYKHHWIWMKDRGTGFQVAKYRPMMQTEDIIVFGSTGKLKYNPQMIKLDKPYYCYNATTTNGTNHLTSFKKGKKIVDYKYPTNVLQFNKVSKPSHPTEKPVDLIQYLIRTYTNEGDLVLDNTMGSGTTCIAAIRENRHYIGMELNLEYFKIAKNRIEQEKQQLKLF